MRPCNRKFRQQQHIHVCPQHFETCCEHVAKTRHDVLFSPLKEDMQAVMMPESDRSQHTCIPRIIRCVSVIFFIMFIVQAIVGCVYIYDCPRAPSIPVFMVICGFIPVFWGLSHCKSRCSIFCNCLFLIFCFAWFIFGSFLIYSNYELDYGMNTTDSNRYCNKTLYLFGLCCITLTYILIGVLVFTFFFARCTNQMEVYDDEARPLLWR
ncbi:transmembrane protein 272 [Haplochromis burtoni]|uniref:transmembrane protein 272 n=1 Tax=Haplochromis burtoni TaxID=8153 RepID=UPI0006C98369|nr:transmembrane protein 272 [Haplochromis burtoni]